MKYVILIVLMGAILFGAESWADDLLCSKDVVGPPWWLVVAYVLFCWHIYPPLRLRKRSG